MPQGRRAEDFSALKNPTDSAGFERANLGIKGQHPPPRPYIYIYIYIYVMKYEDVYVGE